jgi:hypothetical protein
LKVYYNDKIFNDALKEADEDHDYTFTDFLLQLKKWSQRRQLGFDLENQDHLASDMARREHMRKQEQINEGYHPMGKSASYSDSVPTIKIVLQHTRQIQEGEQRYRNIARIFLENMQGERILAPTTRPGLAQIYARHLAEGGVPNDERWNHIKNICEEYQKMSGFVRAVKNKQFNESAQGFVDIGLNHYKNLRATLSRMRGHRGYNNYFDSYTPALMETENDETNLNELFVQETLDPRIESVMPILNKLNKKVNEMSEINELRNWTDKIIKIAEERVTEQDSDIDGDPYEMGYHAATLYHKSKNSNPFEGVDEMKAMAWEDGWQGGAKEEGLDETIEQDVELARRAKEKIEKPAIFRKHEKFLPGTDDSWKVSHDDLEAARNLHDLEFQARKQDLNLDESDDSVDTVKQMIIGDLRNWYDDELLNVLRTHGIDGILAAIDEVAHANRDADEFGSSDRHNLCKNVLSTLGSSSDKVSEDIGPEQKRAGQLGPTEKIAKSNPLRGKLVGANESQENSSSDKNYVCVHAKKGKCEVQANSSYNAAKKAAEKWKLKNTSGIDAYLADKPVSPAQLEEGKMKQMMHDDAEKLTLEQFLDKHCHRPEDRTNMTEIWKNVNNERDDDKDVNESVSTEPLEEERLLNRIKELIKK